MKKIKKLFISIIALLGFVMVGMQNVDAIGERTVKVNGTQVTSATLQQTIEHGKVTVSKHNPKDGEKLTITLAPDKDYELGQLTVKTVYGSNNRTADVENNTYVVQNAAGRGNIEITVLFVPKKTVTINGTLVTENANKRLIVIQEYKLL